MARRRSPSSDADTALVGRTKTDTTFEHANKGFEGAAWLRASGKEYLLALCENNNCKDDDSPPGEGRVQLLSLVDGVWTTERTLKLPESAAFLDYSDLALREQWGRLVRCGSGFAQVFGALARYAVDSLPGPSPARARSTPSRATAEGAVRYCSVEGVTFLGPTVLAAVSDKSDGSEPCTDEEESIHIFQMPQ